MKTIRRVAVLGAGTMGSRIAAHVANAGVPALLLDVVVPGEPDRNSAARRGIETAMKQRPVGFFTEAGARLVTPGNFEDDLPRIRECDWIIEAVTENLEIKRNLWSKVEALRDPDAILSTNTSGIPLARISEGFSPGFRLHFLGTHFFNPPRYLHLAEIIPGTETAPEILEAVSEFCDLRLGKGVVLCKDTPNFIANRIGSFFGATIHKIMVEDDYTIEEVDALTGPLIGLPNSASFRLMDIVGLDVWAYVGRNLYDAVPNDPWRGRLLPPDFILKMIERGWLGEKTGQGFYKRVGKRENREFHAIDWKTLEYHPAQKPKFETAEQARLIEDLPTRLRVLVRANDRVGCFLWKLFSDVFLYSAERIPEISDRIVEIDRAMRWGYAHKLGPFELWDALDFEETVQRMEREGRELPEAVVRMREAGAKAFYRPADSRGEPHTECFDLPATRYRAIEERPGVLSLADIKRARRVVRNNPGASLIDIGDGVLCLEFHSKLNTLGEDHIQMIQSGIDELSRNFEAMVIANQGENFSAGANLLLILLAAQEGDWDELDLAVRRFQQANMALKYAPKPVVAAPFARTLGGGCEIALHAARVQASAELYMGLVEVAVGVIPAAGGCKEMVLRLGDARKAFELIGMAKVSGSADEARNLGLLDAGAMISMNPERLVGDAKALALAMVSGYRPGSPRTDIKVGGSADFAMLKLMAWTMRQSGYISDYDFNIAEKLAHVLSGGKLAGARTVTEQYLLDLEREAFLSLCGNPKTLERMQHMLKTGKPLRN
ncbi:MAG: 3-hydroxyacyl-CoA dehydrogenase/enoyl-CoA hydratase family protein [Bryobacteraceae bacterium]